MTPDRIDRGLEWLKLSLPSLRGDPEAQKQAAAAVTALSEPAHPAQVMARVLALLSPYFDKDTPQAVREIEADDWAEALGVFPYWAVERACRWWKSDSNGDRRKRPLEGDVVARCKVEMQAVRAASSILDWVNRPVYAVSPEARPEISDEERQRRSAQIGEVLEGMRANLGGL
jgi:hypothetical protein